MYVHLQGGLILGPSCLGRSRLYMKKVFPPSGKVILQTLGGMGFMMHLFLLGVQVDATILRRAGRKAVVIGILCTVLPYLLAGSVCLILEHFLALDSHVILSLPYIVAVNSLSSFPVTTSVLTDLNILNSELGRLATSTSIVSDIVSWILLTIMSAMDLSKSELRTIWLWSLLSVAAYFITLVFLVRPFALWVVRQTPVGKPLKEIYICAILVILLGCGLYSEVIGQHASMGAFVLGLAIPDGPPLGAALVHKVDTLISGLLIPVFFTISGLRTNLFSIAGLKSAALIEFIILLGYFGKFTGTILPSLYWKMPFWDAFSLAMIMCSKGIIEVATYGMWKDTKILDTQSYSLMMISMVIVTATARPLVMTLYDPSRRYIAYKRRTIEHSKHNAELRILACIHNQYNVPTIINLLEASNPNRKSPICICVLHLLELNGRASSILVPHNRRNNLSIARRSEPIVNAFKYYEQNNEGHATVQHFTAVSPYVSMHDDICTLALDKRTSLVIVPFHKQWAVDGTGESSLAAVRTVNCNVFDKAPCSVALLVDRGQIGGNRSVLASQSSYRIALLFFGGADDREALAYARRMAEHPSISLRVLRFTVASHETLSGGSEKEKALDKDVINDFRANIVGNERIVFKQKVVEDGVGTTRVIRSMDKGIDLFMVGRNHEAQSPLTLGLTQWSECPELGIIGDMLATSDFRFSVLVMQQQPHGAGLLDSPNHPIARGRGLNSRVFQDSSEDDGDERDKTLAMTDMKGPKSTVGPVEGTQMVCQYTQMARSRGSWVEHNPLDYSTPVLMAQIIIIFIATRTTYVLLKPLGQNMIVAQIVGGLIIGPSFFGRNQSYMEKLFPAGGRVIVEIIAEFGVMLHFFLIGVQMDTSMVKRGGKMAMAIGILCSLGPGVVAWPVYFMARHFLTLDPEMMISIICAVAVSSLSSFPVISSFLADLKILNSDVGRLASSSSMVSDMFNWSVLLLTGGLVFAKHDLQMIWVWSLVSGLVYCLILVFVIRPLALWVARQTPEGKPVKEIYIFSSLLVILGCGFYAEIIGQHAGMGAYMLGLAIPDGPPLGEALVHKIDTLVSGLFIPVFFALCGMRANLLPIGDLSNSVMLAFFVILCYIGKFTATILASLYCKMPFWDAFSLSLIMSCKGISELIVFVVYKEKKFINKQCYSVLLISLVIVTGVSRPLVMFLYDPSRKYKAYKETTILHAKQNSEFRILACIHSHDNVPTIIKLLEVSNPSRASPITVFVLHLMELTGRASAILIRHHRRQQGNSKLSGNSEPIVNAFEYYAQHNQGHVMVQHFTAISPYASMHNDICTLALDKRISILILPFHKQWAIDGVVESSFPAIRAVNCNVLDKAPCSVGILVDRDRIGSSRYVLASQSLYRIALLFLGGADDREALAYARRMAQHPSIRLAVLQFTPSCDYRYGNDKEMELDSELLNNFRVSTMGNERIVCREEVVSDGIGTTRVILSMGNEFDLFMVGRHHDPQSPLMSGLTEWSESPELGIIGDMLASSDFKSSVLVVQQQPELPHNQRKRCNLHNLSRFLRGRRRRDSN
ncbi:hypothetical protein HHK36_016088 [Tetracentron sinense]|uniref:Cation/H+ exchanger domain-containing protein n=1 Tax=Tetracentron sinense TaxID=13715 RepID=A0A834Z247_TETSI|nr:hypothetical protein HHK36_016088 [Tetracentron sinense]